MRPDEPRGETVKIQSAELAASAASAADFPRGGLPEIAFLGRSNVGKSRLLNRMVARRQLARTSSTPGKTRLIHFFEVRGAGDPLRLVDLPGYGWARVSRAERQRWKQLVEAYLGEREVLRVAVLLQDLRRDPGEDEERLVGWLDERRIPVILALTKSDKLPPMRRAQRVRELIAQAPVPERRVVVTSAQTGAGIAELWRAVRAYL